jgi:mannosyl-3-phosphoglycerate phosphatase
VTDRSTYWLIATDLDGTLLDERYDYDAAASAIDSVADSHNALVLLASSKTLAEMLQLARRCTRLPLLLFENGAGVAWRSDLIGQRGEFTLGGYQVLTRLPVACGYQGLRARLNEWRSESGYRFSGFGDLTDSEVADMTGLTRSDAALARQRLCTEPLVWQDSPERLEQFENLLAAEGLQLVSGGRFLHVTPRVSKADAVELVSGWLKDSLGPPRGLLGCGDAANDLALLQHSDIALVFPGADGSYLLPPSDTVHHARAAGSSAWRDAVNQVLNSRSAKLTGEDADE